jgi:hypothetical protein
MARKSTNDGGYARLPKSPRSGVTEAKCEPPTYTSSRSTLAQIIALGRLVTGEEGPKSQ